MFNCQGMLFRINACFLNQRFIAINQCHLVQCVNGLLRNAKFIDVGICVENLELAISKNLEEVEISAPTLEKFLFQGTKLSNFSLNASDMLEVELNFFPQKDDLDHDRLAKFLAHFNYCKTVKLCGRLNKVPFFVGCLI